MSNLVARAYRTALRWMALGYEQRATQGGLLVRERTTPRVYDANFVAGARAERPPEIQALLGEMDEFFSHCRHRRVLWDPGLPAPLEAQLLFDGFQLQVDSVTMVLEGELRARGAVSVELRVSQSEADWQAIEAMYWQNHAEAVAQGLQAEWPRELNEEIVRSLRFKAPAARYFLARVEGVDCGFFAAWPGEEGVGVVEDLYTRTEFRRRGIATALVAACVDDARAHGAGPVIVGARAEDTAIRMFAGLGFRPLCVQRSLLRSVD